MRSAHAGPPAFRAVWGATLLISPERVLERCGNPPGETVQIAARVLGVRQLSEGLLRLPSAGRAGSSSTRAVDVVHAATMLLLAVCGPAAYRRAALVSLTVSGVLAVLD